MLKKNKYYLKDKNLLKTKIWITFDTKNIIFPKISSAMYLKTTKNIIKDNYLLNIII